MEKEKLCLRCMRKIGNNTSCPYCRNESNKPQKEPYLPLKTVVGGKYLIGKVVSSNYICYDHSFSGNCGNCGDHTTLNYYNVQTKKHLCYWCH